MCNATRFLRRTQSAWCLIATVVFVATCARGFGRAIAQDQSKDPLSFEKDILPILQARCVQCHAGKSPKARLDLSTRRSLLKGGRSGAAVRLGAAEFSVLWEKIASGEMPAEGPPLTALEKAAFRTWINEGAKGNDDDPESVELAKGRIREEDRDFWSFRPPARPTVPAVDASDRVRNPIDAFLLARLQEHGLSLSPEAGRLTLLRRATFDLIGLPASPEEIERFSADRAPGAYERLIDRLLASTHYGERWGRHWLDVAGYADSAGILAEDRPLPFAWRYRNYVIRAFNDDKPYDRFLQEQIAGDELTGYWEAYERDAQLSGEVVEGLIATGYLRTAADSSRPDFSTIKNAAGLYFYPTLNDTMQIVASSTMGLTLQCAKCHSHKFDPIPQADFYRVQAVFMSGYRPTQWIPQMQRRRNVATKVQQEAADRRNAEVDANVAALRKQIEQLRTQFADRLFDDRLAKLPEVIREDVRGALAAQTDQRSEVQRYLAAKFQAELRPGAEALIKLLPETYPDFKVAVAKHESQIAAEQRRRIYLEEIRAFYDLPGEVDTPLLHRGDPLTPGPNVAPGALSALEVAEPFHWAPPPAGAKTSGRRLAFARWLTQPSHPLTARVMVNRIWLHHFGEGIVSTPDDFGHSGSPPSHPKLLDWLATEFVARGWSVKQMHRLIMTSSAYRQQSAFDADHRAAAIEADPDNRLLWHQRMRRLEAEPLRDALLSVTGTLDRRLFGRAIPMQRHPDGEVTTLAGSDGNRRSVYLQVLRSNPLTMLQVHDQPVMEINCTRRRESTVATQALTLLNGDSLIQAARAMAQRVLRESPGDPQSRAVLLAFGRPPSEEEQALLADFVATQTQRYSVAATAIADGNQEPGEPQQRALADMCHMLLCANEFVYVD